MVVVDVQPVIALVHNISHWGDLIGNSPLDWLVLAQQVNDPDVLGRMQRAFKNFIDSGQVWALLIGLVAGYVFRGMTSY